MRSQLNDNWQKTCHVFKCMHTYIRLYVRMDCVNLARHTYVHTYVHMYIMVIMLVFINTVRFVRNGMEKNGTDV